ncbi:MAG: hypothetical protein PVH64_13690 [Bacillota bacterium]|jgi:hypothetical protein
MKKIILIIGFLMLLTTPSLVAAKDDNQYIQIVKNDGGKILGGEELKDNDISSLHLEWYVLNDPTCPVQLIGAGVREYQQMGSYPLTYYYQATLQLQVQERVTAYQVKFHLYNVFGQFLDELVVYKVRDLEAKEIYPQEEFFTRMADYNLGALLKVIAYITYIRKADGSLWRYPESSVTKIVAGLTNTK